MRLEVRCCCRPEKLVGHCDWPDIRSPQHTVTRLRSSSLEPWVDSESDSCPKRETFTFVLADVSVYMSRFYRAVKAEDAPQWALERLPGWVAA